MKDRQQKLHYLVTGGGVYLFEVLVIVVAQAAGFNGVAAVALSFWLGLGLSFLLQKTLTFQDKRFHVRVLSLQVMMYSLLVAFNFAFTLFFTYSFRHILPALVSRTLALGVCTIWNFYLYKTHIFGQNLPVEM